VRNGIVFAVSTDRGATFSKPRIIEAVDGAFSAVFSGNGLENCGDARSTAHRLQLPTLGAAADDAADNVHGTVTIAYGVMEPQVNSRSNGSCPATAVHHGARRRF